jgi:hypothetical protein
MIRGLLLVDGSVRDPVDRISDPSSVYSGQLTCFLGLGPLSEDLFPFGLVDTSIHCQVQHTSKPAASPICVIPVQGLDGIWNGLSMELHVESTGVGISSDSMDFQLHLENPWNPWIVGAP